LIVETHHGLVCANAGVDQSNVDADTACLLPEDSDRSARGLRDRLEALTGHRLGIIIADTFGRPWREGLTNVAIGVAGLEPLQSYPGEEDPAGHVLQATILALAAMAGMSNLDAATAASVVVLTLPATGLAATLAPLKDACRGKVVISTVVPLTFGGGRLFTPPSQGSSAEEVQELLDAEARVVAAFHHIAAHELSAAEHAIECDLLLCGEIGRASCRERV